MMDTMPMELDALAASHGGLDDFRIASPREVLAVLRQLCDGNARLTVNGGNGVSASTTLWAVDSEAGMLSFAADLFDPYLPQLVEADDAVVVGYLDSVKIQFDVSHMMMVRGASGSVLRCALPGTVYRFQRRNAYRVRPLLRSSPTAKLRHPGIPDMALALRVLDVSMGGCALFQPDDVPPMAPGGTIGQALFELDADTRFQATLRLLHVSQLNPESKGARLGCEFVKPGAELERALQRYIDQTQKRRRMMSLD